MAPVYEWTPDLKGLPSTVVPLNDGKVLILEPERVAEREKNEGQALRLVARIVGSKDEPAILGPIQEGPLVSVNASGNVGVAWSDWAGGYQAFFDGESGTWASSRAAPAMAFTLDDRDAAVLVATRVAAAKFSLYWSYFERGEEIGPGRSLTDMRPPHGNSHKWTSSAKATSVGGLSTVILFNLESWPLDINGQYTTDPWAPSGVEVLEPVAYRIDVQGATQPTGFVPFEKLRPAGLYGVNLLGTKTFPIAQDARGLPVTMWVGRCPESSDPKHGAYDCLWATSPLEPNGVRVLRNVDFREYEGLYEWWKPSRELWTLTKRAANVAAVWFEPDTLRWSTYDASTQKWGEVQAAKQFECGPIRCRPGARPYPLATAVLANNRRGDVAALWDQVDGIYVSLLRSNAQNWASPQLLFSARGEELSAAELSPDGSAIHVVTTTYPNLRLRSVGLAE